jgi:hypothetical protein
MTQLPKYVVHFYREIEYALQCIAFKQITFLHREKLNDPFDLYYRFETDFDEDYETLINYVKQHHANYFQEFKQILPKENWESALMGMEKYLMNVRNNIFIFSSSETSEDNHVRNNLYMWSHYGNGHRGVAIQFDTFLLANAVLQQQEKLGCPKMTINDLWSKINYHDDLPDITCEHIFQYVMNSYNNELRKIMDIRFSSKSIGWEMEKEWRLIWLNDETKLKILRLNLLDGSVTAIYLGCNYPLGIDYMNDAIIFEARRHFPKAEIFKMKKKKGKFALEFEQIVVPADRN